MSAFGGKIVATKGLFSAAELSRARTNRENICRSSGRDSAGPVSLGSGRLSPQWLRITTETFCCVFVDLIKHGVRGKLCCPACEGWDLVIYWSPLTSYSKARSCETYCSGSWQTHWLLSHRTSSLVFLLPLSKIPPSNTSVVPTRWHHTTWVSQEWHFFKPSVRRTWGNTENFAWCVLRQGFQKGKRQQNFIPEVSPLSNPTLSPFAGNPTIYARAASETSPEQPGEAGTSLPAVPSSGNESLRFKRFFVYEIKSTRPITNCLC